MFVVDTSVAGSWYLPDESDPYAEEALSRVGTDGAIVPALFWFELRNVFLMGERRRRISETDTVRFLSTIARLSIVIDRDPNEAVIFQLARLHKLTIYDAAYLELAQRKNLALATLDHALIKAAKAEKIALLAAAKSQLP